MSDVDRVGVPGTTVSQSIVEAVADLEETDPTRLDAYLHDVVDPEALDAVFAGPDRTVGTVNFEFCGYSITVSATGRVIVSGENGDRMLVVPPDDQ